MPDLDGRPIDNVRVARGAGNCFRGEGEQPGVPVVEEYGLATPRMDCLPRGHVDPVFAAARRGECLLRRAKDGGPADGRTRHRQGREEIWSGRPGHGSRRWSMLDGSVAASML